MRVNLLIILLSFVSTIGGCMDSRETLTPRERLEKFYSEGFAEPNLVPFLVAGGDEMVPILLNEITDMDMPKRRYAIGALGNLGNIDAVPVLHEIVRNEIEEDYFRCDAIQSIESIDATSYSQLIQEVDIKELGCEK